MTGLTQDWNEPRKSTGITLGFVADENGAVTVDWVVLTAAIIGFGMLVLIPVAFSADSASTRVGANIGNLPVGYQTGN